MIGLFDSGSGGLSVLTALRKRAPNADVVYFGDIANAPYGIRTPDDLKALTEKGVRLLLDTGATEIVSACNSVSYSVLAGAAHDARVIEMTRPTAHMMRAHAGKCMLLIATPATIAARIYKDALGVTVILDELSIPELAGAIELGAPEGELKRIVRNAFRLREGNRYDGIILGCTHYPLVRNVIEECAKEAFGNTEIIDPAVAVAEDAVQRFDVSGSGTVRFLLSKDSQVFRNRINELFPDGRYTIETI